MTQPYRPQAVPNADPLWYKDAIIYQTHVKAFFDTNGDGTGDFRGLTAKLDYIHELGADCIWLLPFYPSPLRDDGYDIADYRNVNPAYGSRRDFRHFVSAAHRRGIRVIVELIVNHTSDQHPWFQAARRAPKGSSKRAYYVWSDDDKRFPETRIIFTDTESSNWTWDPVARQYYWHRFFSHQPDLNHNNPQVVKAMIRVMRFWLDLGVDGLRLDAIPYLCVREGTNNENLPETHAVIKQMRAVVDAHYENRVFLAEANQWPEDVRDYFGDGDECHMAYHFPLMPRMYMALAQEERHPIVEILEQTPEIPPSCQWAIFLRNHDELTLEMVSDRERDYMYRTYAADPRMRVNVGIRRRLTPLLGNDPSKIRLMVSLLLSMPGSPILYYGDEIGMGDNIYLGDRNAVRTPMQWSPDRNAGFSRADPEQLYLPPVMDPIYGYPSVNVEAQSRAPASLLNWTCRIIAVRKAHRVFGRGLMECLHPGNRKVLAYVRRFMPDPSAGALPTGPSDEIVLCVANLARGAQPVELDLAHLAGRVPIELMGQTAFPPIGELPYLLTLPGHGFYWFLLSTEAEAPAWHDERIAAPRLATLVLPEAWLSLLPARAARRRSAERALALLQERVLPGYLGAVRYRARAGVKPRRMRVDVAEPWQDWLLMLVRVEWEDGSAERLFLPLAIEWEQPGAQLPSVPSAATTLARVRRQARPGQLFEALADPGFVLALVGAIGAGTRIAFGAGWLVPRPTSAFAALAGEDLAPSVQVLAEDKDNGVVLGGRLVLKTLRCGVVGTLAAATDSEVRNAIWAEPGMAAEAAPGLEPSGEPGAAPKGRNARGPGVEPEVDPRVEMARYLTETAKFANIPALAGHVDFRDGAGRCRTLALLEQFVPNQGDLASRAKALLTRLCDEHFCAGAWRDDPGQISFLNLIDALGTRTGEFHFALVGGAETEASASGETTDAVMRNPAFAPEAITPEEATDFRGRLRATAERALEQLARRRQSLSGAAREAAEALSGARGEVLDVITTRGAAGLGPLRCRIHGDLRLERVLAVQDDVVLTGAGGPLGTPADERRRKHPPWRDLGTLLHSLHQCVAEVVQTQSAENPDLMVRLASPIADWRRDAARGLIAAHANATPAWRQCGGQGAPDADFGGLVWCFALETALAALDDALTHRAADPFVAIAVAVNLSRDAAAAVPPVEDKCSPARSTSS